MKESVLVIGGDKRYYIAAELISDLGYTVYVCGFEFLANKIRTALFTNLPYTDYILLPAPFKDEEDFIKMPFSDKRFKLNELLPQLRPDAYVITGGVDLETQVLFEDFGISYCDLLLDESYTVKNSYITAQAALMVAADKSSKALSDCQILICGFGRIGKSLAALFKGYGSEITVSARKDKDIEWIGIGGYKPVYTHEIDKVIAYQDIVFNTIPCCVLGQKELVRAKKSVILLELASKHFGINLEEASRLGLKTYVELGLPGRCFPDSAAKTVADAFQRIVKRGW